MAVNVSVTRFAEILVCAELATGQSLKPFLHAAIDEMLGLKNDTMTEEEFGKFLHAGLDYMVDHPWAASIKTGGAIFLFETTRKAILNAIKGRKSVSIFGLVNLGP